MPMPRALTDEQMKQAAELYHLDRRSRREVAAILRCSETAVRTALYHAQVPMRDKLQAAAQATKSRTGFRRTSQLVTSVFDMGAK